MELRRPNTLAWRLVLYIVLFSSLVTLILTAIQLYLEYNTELVIIDQRLQTIEISSKPPIANDLWTLNLASLRLQAEGLLSLRDVKQVAILDEQGDVVLQLGRDDIGDQVEKAFPLLYAHRGEQVPIGELRITVSLEGVYQRLLDRIIVILISQAAKTFLVSMFILFLFHYMVTRHLNTIGNYVSRIHMHGDEPPLMLGRSASPAHLNDVLGKVVQAINAMQQSLRVSFRQLARHRDQLEVDVEHRTRELENKNRELTSFCYSISHDLRTPLRSINGFAHAVLEDYGDQLDEQGRAYLNRVCHSANHMGELMDDLLSLSRVSQQDLKFETINLSNLAMKFADQLKRQHSERQCQWTIERGIEVLADNAGMQVAIQNLLENAWKYSSKKQISKIELGTVQIGGERVIFVRDNGAGFNMEYADKLFQPFHRLHSSREFPGSGVGLATVHRVIERHSGRIWAESEPDRGATFYFVLPEQQVHSGASRHSVER